MTEQERAAASAENYRRMRAELDRRMILDPELRQISKKIKDGTADFSDTFRYSELVSKHIGAVMQAHIGEITNPLGKEYVCKALLEDHYEAINDVLGTVQVSLDEELGIHLKPIKPPKPLERIQQVAHALEDPGVKPEVIKRRAGAPVVNTAMSMHDSYIKINAQKRHDLGFKCYLNRVAVSGCCKWCTEIAGRYVYGDHPKDIFRRHDNCNCTVTFENGRKRQDVWSKRTWDANDPQEVMQNASEPTVLSQDAAESLQNAALSRLTLAGKRDILREESKKPITQITDAAIDRVPKVSVTGKTDQQNAEIQNQHRNLLELSRRENFNNEVAFVFDSNIENRKEFFGKDDMLEFGQLYGHDLFIMHNHPRNSSYSATDIIFMIQHSEVQTLSIVKNNGSVEALTKSASFDAEELKKDFGRILKKTVKTESVAEYDKAVKKLLEKHSGDGGMLEWIK